MAEVARVARLHDDDALPAWQTLIELDRAGLSQSLTLVGGLMVYSYARAANLTSPRPTADADILVDVVTGRPIPLDQDPTVIPTDVD